MSAMTCKDLAEFLMRYVDGEMPEDERKQFEAHMAICPSCIDYIASYKQTIELGKMLCADEDAPAEDAGAPESLIRAILAARGRHG